MRAPRPRRSLFALGLGLLAATVLPAAATAAEAGTATASAGIVSATATWKAAEIGVSEPRLTIVRGGVTLFDGSPMAQSESCATGTFCRIASSGRRASALQVRDLDGDGEPEVLLDAFTGGAHCCAVTEVFRFSGSGYVGQELTWGDFGYGIRDLDGDGRPEFVAVDPVFAYEFTAFAFSRFPVLILDWSAGTVTPVTKRFPARVRLDAAAQRSTIRSLRRQRFDLRGVIAAYVADLYLLGQPHAAIRYLDAALHRGDLAGDPIWKRGRQYRTALLAFLRQHGYR